MVSTGYLWERFCWLSYTPFLLYTAATNPSYFGHLTYWTLTLHAVYFTVDKASPEARYAIYLLQGMSFAGAIAVFIGYTFISLGGTYRFGSWNAWENAVGARAGTVHHNRGLSELVFQKSYEHVWPVFASVLDAYFRRGELTSAFRGAPKLRTTILAVGSYLVFGTVWEQTQKSSGKGSPLDVYVQPEGMATSKILGQFGISAPGLPEDLIFTNLQKVLLISGAFFAYWRYVAPVMNATAKAKAK